MTTPYDFSNSTNLMNEESAERLLLRNKTQSIREAYLKFLSGMVSYNNGLSFQPRTRKPEQWSAVPVQDPVDISDANVWLWSDLHFGHKNIIKFSDRPFVDIPEMDRLLIDNFNSVVKPEDVSIWVGDITFYNVTRSREIVNRCNGYKILVAGNHDFEHGKLKDMGFDEVHIVYLLQVDGVEMVLTHYPFPVEYPQLNIHGHEHIAKQRTAFSTSPSHINVCCEYHNYKPINLTQIVEWAKSNITSFAQANTHPRPVW